MQIPLIMITSGARLRGCCCRRGQHLGHVLVRAVLRHAWPCTVLLHAVVRADPLHAVLQAVLLALLLALLHAVLCAVRLHAVLCGLRPALFASGVLGRP